MAWDCKYITEFTDILGLDWKIEVEDETIHSVDPAVMQLSGSPLTITYLNNSETLIQSPIRGSMAVFSIESDSHFKYLDLHTIEDLQYRVKIYYSGSELYWMGYIVINDYTEPYDSVPYTVNISAACGLGLLKRMIYKDGDDNYYDSRLTIAEIIIDILTKIGYTGFTEYINIYEESMSSGATDSPFDQLCVDVDIFKDMYCYEVLEELLNLFNACICIIAGQPIIYRPSELNNALVYGRVFTDQDTHTGTSIAPEQLIKRIGIKSDIRDVNNGSLSYQRPAQKVTILHNYGNKESWLDNFDFEAVTVDEDNVTLDFWANNNPDYLDLKHISSFVVSEKNGICISTTNALQQIILTQNIGSYSVISNGDKFVFSIDFGWYNDAGGALSDIPLAFRIKQGSNYLNEIDETTAEWSATSTGIIIFPSDVGLSAFTGWTGWFTWKREFTGIESADEITIELYNQAYPEVYSCFNNILFYCSSFKANKHFAKTWARGRRERQSTYSTKYNEALFFEFKVISKLTREYTKLNAIKGDELYFDTLLGDVNDTEIDNVVEQFAGSLSTRIRTLLQRVDDVTLTSSLSSGTVDITVNGQTESIAWFTSLAQTATLFINLNETSFPGVNLSSGGSGVIKFTGAAGATLTVTAENNGINPDLSGTVVNTQPNTYSDAIAYTSDWNTRGGSESKEILSIICDEIAIQYSRANQFLNLPIMEDKKYSNTPHVNILGNFQDSLNQLSGNNRKFVFNKGSFNVRDREHNIDLIEII